MDINYSHTRVSDVSKKLRKSKKRLKNALKA